MKQPEGFYLFELVRSTVGKTADEQLVRMVANVAGRYSR